MGSLTKLSVDTHSGSPPAVDMAVWGETCLTVPRRLVPYIIGALRPLTWPETWSGSAVDMVTCAAQVETALSAMLTGACRECRECVDGQGGADCALGAGYAGGYADDCEVDMAYGYIIDVEWRNGVLWVRRSGCCEWESVGAGQGAGGDVDIPPELEPEVGYSACGKARAIAEFLDDIGDIMSTWGATGSILAVAKVYYEYPWLSGGQHWFVNAAAQMSLITGLNLAYRVDFGLHTDWETYICRLEPLLIDGPDPLTDEEWSAIEDELLAVHGFNIFARNFWAYVLRGIGQGDMSMVAQTGSLNTGAVCECPGQVIDPRDGWPDDLTWRYWADLRNGLPDWLQLAGESALYLGAGVRDLAGSTGSTKPGVRLPELLWSAGQVVKYLYIKWAAVGGTDYTGNQVRVYPGSGSQFYSGAGDDGDPSMGGTFVKVINASYDPADSGDYVQWDVEMNTLAGDDDTKIPTILEIGIGGIGDDPLADL